MSIWTTSLLLDVVVKRILIATLDGGLYGRIVPQRLHCRKALGGERFLDTDVLCGCYHSLVLLRPSVWSQRKKSDSKGHYVRLSVGVVHPNLSHLFRNDFESHDHIREDDLTDFLSLLQVETLGVDDPHLLQDGGFAGFAGTWDTISHGPWVCEWVDGPSSRILTCRASIFLSLRSNLSISMFFFFSSLVSRCRAFPPPLLLFGKHMLKTMENDGRAQRNDTRWLYRSIADPVVIA